MIARPPTEELAALGVLDLGSQYRRGEASPVEATETLLARIERLDPALNAYRLVLGEQARVAAAAAERQLRAGIDLGPLHGIPFAVKDIMDVRGTPTTAGSRVLLQAPIAGEDAVVVRRLRAAGAVLLGKTNLHEFGRGATDPSGPFREVENPRAIGRQPGGSSSGSAAAVAAGMATFALGTDTGGSVRTPANLCGIVGLKPTYGLVSLRGVIPCGIHFDTVGPLGRSVADVAATLEAMAGHNPADPTSVIAPVPDYLAALSTDVAGMRLGIPTNTFYRFGQPAVLTSVDEARQTLVGLGMAPVRVDLPRSEEIYDIGEIIIGVDVLTYHRRYAGSENLYGPDFRRKLELSRSRTGEEYAAAREAQAAVRRAWLDLFECVDVIALPGNVAGAPPRGQEEIEMEGIRHPIRAVLSPFNRAANLTGFPSLVVPVAETAEGMPVGLQLLGPPFSEPRLFAVGHALEQAIGSLPSRWGIEPRSAPP
jgi:aspartyl-tRNA(Asn)/glutamyl-tRNA(Gln) amidotransferase subunit A